MALASGNLPQGAVDSVARNDFNDAMAQLDAAFPLAAANIATDAVETLKIKDLNVTTAKLALLAVTAAQIATDAVETLKIKDRNVTTAKIALLGVTAAELAADAVETLKIKDLNVTTGKLALLSVTAAQLAADAVETLKIKDLNVTTGKLALLSVTAAQLAADAVETLKIKDGQVTDAKLDALDKGRFENALLHIQDQKAAGTGGGSFTRDAWRTRDINTVLTNEITGASLASNQITLPAGTYYIDARAPAYRMKHHKIRIYDTTTPAALIIGSTIYASDGDYVMNYSHARGRFTLAAEKVLEVQHYATNVDNAAGFGHASSLDGTVEVYTEVLIWKI